MKVACRQDGQRVRRAAEWGKTKYAGSIAEGLWRRLDAMDFINQGMLFVEQRLAEIRDRYGPGDLVSRSMRRATPMILRAVEQVHHRAAQIT